MPDQPFDPWKRARELHEKQPDRLRPKRERKTGTRNWVTEHELDRDREDEREQPEEQP